jgi:DNA repair exonuclease SbcCD ATPase subunit
MNTRYPVVLMVLFSGVLAGSSLCRGGDEASEASIVIKPSAAAGVRDKIADLDVQMAKLEQEKQALEQLNELHDQSQDRIHDADTEMDDLDREAPVSPARIAFVDARRDYLKKRRGLDAEILAIQSAAGLKKAQDLKQKLDELDLEWELLRGPGLDLAADIEDMTAAVQENGGQAKTDILKKFKALAEESATARKQEFELAKARLARQAAIETLKRDFQAGQ